VVTIWNVVVGCMLGRSHNRKVYKGLMHKIRVINMPQIQIKCDGCGKEFYTKQRRVWVFKQRFCNVCREPLVKVPNTNYLRCNKCEISWNLDDKDTVASLGVSIIGTSRNIMDKVKAERKGYEIEKILTQHRYKCQLCTNRDNMRNQAIMNMQRRVNVMPELTAEQKQDRIKREIANILRREAQERKEDEQREKAEIEKAKLEAKKKEKPTEVVDARSAVLMSPESSEK